MLSTRRRLAVWGDPIAHSLSPRLHAAAYATLGLDWEYGRRRVDAAAFPAALSGLDDHWRGLSLTMPLKTAAFAAAVRRDPHAERSGAVNTLLLTGAGPVGFNTDVGGMAADLAETCPGALSCARIVGAGSTATSALLALRELGAREVEVVARRPEAAATLCALGERLGVRTTALPFTARAYAPVQLTVAALPGGAAVDEQTADAAASAGGILYDVVYGHWPTALAAAWQRAGGQAVPGVGMLTRQALLQVRIFVRGDPLAELDDEPRVLAAMREAVTGV